MLPYVDKRLPADKRQPGYGLGWFAGRFCQSELQWEEISSWKRDTEKRLPQPVFGIDGIGLRLEFNIKVLSGISSMDGIQDGEHGRSRGWQLSI